VLNTYSKNVFINCPFDQKYKKLFIATIFVIHDAGLYTRCSLEFKDSSVNRIDKIVKIISECKFGINDISRIETEGRYKLPRFNMPFELGLFLGCKKYGFRKQKQKSCLILDKKPYRYQKFLSDISGYDIFSHNNKTSDLIVCIRDWLQTESNLKTIPSSEFINSRYKKFLKSFPKTEKKLLWNNSKEFTFIDYQNFVIEWLKINSNKKTTEF
jgi:hypothetical protein